MILMCSGTYPLTSTMKAVEVFLETMKTPIPDYVETLGFYTCWGGDGIVFYMILDIKDGNIDEGLKDLRNRLANYMSVDGYKVKYEVLTSVEESLAVVGKEMPAS